MRAGKLKAFAVASGACSAAVPDVPTVKESGYPSFEAYIWFGMFAPPGTPAEIVNRLNAEITRIMRAPEMPDRVAALGGEFLPQAPAQFRDFVRSGSEQWQKIIKATAAKAR